MCIRIIGTRGEKVGNPEYVPRFSRDKQELVPRWDTFQYVPLLRTLIQDPDILEKVEGFHLRMSGSSLQEDFCDGTLFCEHPLFSSNPLALQILVYFDELEVCNPLDTHIKKHKLGIVFFMLGNIRSKLHSSLKAIEKHGLNKILEPFITDLNLLATKEYMVMSKYFVVRS